MVARVNPLAGRNWAGVPSPNPSYSPSGTLWPNGEFSQGWKRHQGDERLDMRPLADSWDDAKGGGGAPPPLDLVNVPNSHRPRGLRGSLGITTYGRRMLRNAIYILRERFPNHPATLGTLTLPPLQTSARRELSGQWGEVVRQVLQWLTRELRRRGLPPLVLSCSEIQPSRLETDKGAYLHLHLVWLNPPRSQGGWGVSADRLRSFWASLVRRLVDDPNIPVPNIDLQVARGDIARELSKYLSKGSDCLSKAAEDLGVENMPRTWWNMSAPLRALIKDAIRKGGEVGLLLLEWLAFDQGLGEEGIFLWCRPITVDLEGRLITMGHTGQLTAALNGDAHDLLSHGETE